MSNKFPFLCRIIFTSLCQRARYRKSGNDWHVMSDMKKKVQIIMILSIKALKTKIVVFANSIDPDEAAHYELPHPELYCLPSSL